MITPHRKPFRSRNQSCLPAGAFHAALLLIALVSVLSQVGCTTRNYYIYQLGYGENRIDAEVLKEETITPTLKASLK